MKKTIEVCDKCEKEKPLTTISFPHSVYYRCSNPDADPGERKDYYKQVDADSLRLCAECGPVISEKFMYMLVEGYFDHFPDKIEGDVEYRKSKYHGRQVIPGFNWGAAKKLLQANA